MMEQLEKWQSVTQLRRAQALQLAVHTVPMEALLDHVATEDILRRADAFDHYIAYGELGRPSRL